MQPVGLLEESERRQLAALEELMDKEWHQELRGLRRHVVQRR
jgi:hypothetical protein